MATDQKTMKRLKAAADEAAEFATAAKEDVRTAKAKLKHARKLFKAAKKVAKQARRKVGAAAAAATAAPDGASLKSAKPRAVPKATAQPKIKLKPSHRAEDAVSKPQSRVQRRAPNPSAPTPPEPMRSAAEVAKSVIERLHSPPPLLPPTPPTVTDPSEPGS